MTRIAVILTSTRAERFADRPAAWVVDRLRRDGVDVDVIDMREHDLPSFDAPAPIYTPRRYATEAVAELGRRIDAADGFVVLTGEYNHGYTGVFKNAVDHFYVEWDRKPVAFVGWGNVGGARAVEQLRTVSIELGMAPIRPAVHILPETLVPAMTADASDPALFSGLDAKLDALVSELMWWAHALDAARSTIAA
ncbi:NADPH-dependent FMN reductase [Mycolicibacterium goodii]|uniref:NADPH-dependent FMN reductase n=1 Tax=Mycolicibacterium goodii TaxID=134601 RepID=UPI001BDBEB4C|nr:NAD(P)H-dependent oxidoreductase [Mycolicibacterium goodii]MBU8811335.1 NAD(P)H-dependent oxidoreductase [Mycolicibacterium goodii]MBU8831849.1 NAD(P)H-dependent oxidoreductase [Mycolicibacterium goodii]ULN45398.1 NAD(P)H-dependent oxidoreductase [Mycolicibacterium goodii]